MESDSITFEILSAPLLLQNAARFLTNFLIVRGKQFRQNFFFGVCFIWMPTKWKSWKKFDKLFYQIIVTNFDCEHKQDVIFEPPFLHFCVPHWKRPKLCSYALASGLQTEDFWFDTLHVILRAFKLSNDGNNWCCKKGEGAETTLLLGNISKRTIEWLRIHGSFFEETSMTLLQDAVFPVRLVFQDQCWATDVDHPQL